MKTKRKLVSILIAALLVLTALPSAALANSVPSAQGDIIKSATLQLEGNSLKVANYSALQGAAVEVSVNGNASAFFNEKTFSYDLGNASIGDKHTVTLYAKLDGYEDQTLTLSYAVSPKDYANINGLEDCYMLTFNTQNGVSGIKFSDENYAAHSNGYYFFDVDEAIVTLNTIPDFAVMNCNINFGTVTVMAGSTNILKIKFDESVKGVSAPYIVSADAGKVDLSGIHSSTYYEINASAGEGGTILLPGEIIVQGGNSQTFVIITHSGYVIDSVLVDGEDQGAVSAYTFAFVIDNHTIEANFVKAEDVDATLPGSVSELPEVTPSIPRTSAALAVIPAAALALGSLALLIGRRKNR